MLEICPSLTTRTAALEIHPLGIGGKEDPVRLVFDTDAGPGVVVALSDMRDRFRLTANVVDVVAARRAAAATCPWPARCGGRSPDFATSAEAWLMAGAAHHTVLSTQVGVEAFADFAEHRPDRAAGDRRGHHARAGSPRSCAGTRPTTGWRRACDGAVAGRAAGRSPGRCSSPFDRSRSLRSLSV